MPSVYLAVFTAIYTGYLICGQLQAAVFPKIYDGSSSIFLEVLVLFKLLTRAESQKRRLCTKYISDAFPEALQFLPAAEIWRFRTSPMRWSAVYWSA